MLHLCCYMEGFLLIAVILKLLGKELKVNRILSIQMFLILPSALLWRCWIWTLQKEVRPSNFLKISFWLLIKFQKCCRDRLLPVLLMLIFYNNTSIKNKWPSYIRMMISLISCFAVKSQNLIQPNIINYQAHKNNVLWERNVKLN